MIDIHTHVLPGLDDGSASLKESIELAAAAAADGVRILVATPHLRHDHPHVRPVELAGRCHELNDELRRKDLDIEVLPGGELDVAWAQTASDEELRLVSYAQAGAYLLVETPYGRLPDMFEEMLFQIASRGYRIVLAHPERNPSFQAKPDRLRALVERDVAIQVTAHSLEPTRRKSKTGRLARALLTDDLAHVVASDFHRPVGTRRPQLSQAMAAVDRVSPGIGRWMVDDVPTAILAGAALPRRPVSSSSRPRWRVLRSKR